MRKLALAAAAGAGLILGGVAFAGPWSDTEAGRISFNTPFSNIDPPSRTATQTTVLTFDGSHDCYVIGSENSVTSNSSPDAVIRTTSEPIAASAWVATANSVRDFFPQQQAQLTAQRVDTSGVWPVQRAEFSGSEGTVYAAMQSRPGYDLMAFCRALGSAGTAQFETLFSSLSHPRDAEWASAYEQQQQNRAAAAAAAAAAAEQQQVQQVEQEAEDEDEAEEPTRTSRDPRNRRRRD